MSQKCTYTQHAVEFTSNKKIIFGAIVIWRFAFDLLLDIREETRVIPAKKGQKYFSSRCIYSRNACNFYLPLSFSLDRFFFEKRNLTLTSSVMVLHKSSYCRIFCYFQTIYAVVLLCLEEISPGLCD